MNPLKTPDGLGEGQPLTDIQEYNRRLGILSNWLKGLVVILGIWTLIVLWLIWYVIHNGVVNNIVARCV